MLTGCSCQRAHCRGTGLEPLTAKALVGGLREWRAERARKENKKRLQNLQKQICSWFKISDLDDLFPSGFFSPDEGAPDRVASSLTGRASAVGPFTLEARRLGPDRLSIHPRAPDRLTKTSRIM